MCQKKSCGGNQNKFYVLSLFFFKLCHLWHKVEKYCRVGQGTDAEWHMYIACWLAMATHTLTVCNTCFSTATMVARTCLNITFICTLPVLFVVDFVLSRFVTQVLSVWLEMVPVVPIVIGISFAFTFHLRLNSVVRFLYFRIFSAFLITFLSPEIAASIYIHVLFLLSWIMMPDWFLGMVLSVCTCWFNISLPYLHLSCFQESTF